MAPTCMPEVPFSSLGTGTVVLIETNRGSPYSLQTIWQDYKYNTSIMSQPVPSKFLPF